MVRLICFTDNQIVAQKLHQELTGPEYTLDVLPASKLTTELREAVERLAPNVILLEVSRAIDNPHLYFFLRSDRATRDVPIILFSSSKHLAEEALLLGAEGYLPLPFGSERLRTTLVSCLQLQRALAA